MKKQPKGFLVTYLYVSPDGTYADEKPNVLVNTGLFNSLQNALEFIGELFDGKETWDERIVPDILKHMELCNYSNPYHVDDYSAGQWAEITPVFDWGNVTHAL